MITPKDAVIKDLETFKNLGGEIKYPFPVDEFAIKVFGLDIHYEDFGKVFSSNDYDPKELFGCLFPDNYFFCEMDKIILINSNRAPFKIGDQIVPKEYYEKNSERQTIAHEIGHYSGKYVHNKETQTELFPKPIKTDAGTSILIYPKEEETYASKYAKELLVPKEELKKLIAKNNIHGTIDLRSQAILFTEYFGVTQFMIEIRLNELKIHFINGVYIKKANRFKGEDYTEKELLTLIDLVAEKFNMDLSYYDSDSIVDIFNKIAETHRASGPLYMTFNRLMKGDYDKFPNVFEKRISKLIEIDKKIKKEQLKNK
jgi:Zn-dependent peptidase ImmA (M78 family)